MMNTSKTIEQKLLRMKIGETLTLNNKFAQLVARFKRSLPKVLRVTKDGTSIIVTCIE